jgi:hypothetical protein
MTPGDLLNADMATVGRALRAAIEAWREELAALLPRGGFGSGGGAEGPALFVEDGRARLVRGGAFQDEGTGPSPAGLPVLVPATSGLVRTIELPRLGRADLVRLLDLEGERYFPMPAGAALYAVGPSEVEGDRMRVAIAAMPLALAEPLAPLAPAAVRLADAARMPDPRFDFAPAMRARGLLGPVSTARRDWWLIVLFLIALNLALLVWRDAAEVDRLRALVDEQRPAAAVAQRIVHQMRAADRMTRAAAVRRRDTDAIALLADISRAVPDGAWVQRYAYEGRALRLTGYRLPDADVAGALRRLPRVASVKSAQADEAAGQGLGQPFDLVVALRGR